VGYVLASLTGLYPRADSRLNAELLQSHSGKHTLSNGRTTRGVCHPQKLKRKSRE